VQDQSPRKQEDRPILFRALRKTGTVLGIFQRGTDGADRKGRHRPNVPYWQQLDVAGSLIMVP